MHDQDEVLVLLSPPQRPLDSSNQVMEPPAHNLTPFPPPPPIPRTGVFGWVQRRLSKVSLREAAAKVAVSEGSPPPPLISLTPSPRNSPQLSPQRGPSQPPPQAPQIAQAVSRTADVFRPSSSSEIRRVQFPEPTTTAFFSPPSVPSASRSSSASSLLDSSLPETGSICSILPTDSPRPLDSDVPLGLRAQWNLSLVSLHEVPRVTYVDSKSGSLVQLYEHEVQGVAPFLVFLMGMPFVGVASHMGCVCALGHGIKRAVAGVKVEGGRRVVYSQRRRVAPSRGQMVEVPVYGAEYTAYDVDGGQEV